MQRNKKKQRAAKKLENSRKQKDTEVGSVIASTSTGENSNNHQDPTACYNLLPFSHQRASLDSAQSSFSFRRDDKNATLK